MYKKQPSIHYLISLRRSIAVMLIVISLLNSKSIYAQEAIDNEYRLIVVPTYPISEKFYITTYLGYVNNMDSKIISTYIGLPGLLVYKPKKNFQLQAGCFLVLNNDKSEINKDSKEMRYVLGEKINLPNTNDLRIYNWTRYELRSFNYENNDLNKTNNRIRSRFGIEFPVGKNPWQANSWYGITDFECFYTFEKGYMERFRQRFGVGYIIDKQWTLNFVYHIQLDRANKDLNPDWTTNIFRLDVRWNIPHKVHPPLTDAPDTD
jgi:hypothetical protein